MAISMWEVAIITILVIVAVTFGISYYLSNRLTKTLAGSTITRGMNGLAGTTVSLQCPAGMNISFSNLSPTTRGALLCSGDASLDAFASPTGSSMYNTANIVDVFGAGSQFTDLLGCAGANTCSWAIPTTSDPRLAGTPVAGCTGQLQFIGTYDCVGSA
jgi:hypothetical protein